MDNEKALEILKFNIAFGNLGHIDINALDIAIQAVEKQIPKKPRPRKGFEGRCVCCGVVFLDRLTNYCGNCGQALDWSDT